MEEFFELEKEAYLYAIVLIIFVICSVLFMLNYDFIINSLKVVLGD
ncbi:MULTISPECIES: hypothetical protein [Bacteria]|jgi:hypothetical protein|uniref:Uncharacterized protein n=2 Tax=Bacillus cereus TaxID=1396 RepID=A0A9W5RBY0_BACCE|nr:MULTISPECIES: hypothetical protein [Bacteria]HDR7253856.1 hypothetical protein [Bacillus pacificus]HDR7765440.1 hypothetical protein [Bacillus paranthracis]AJI08870.1 hypothetical protein AK40_5611 [Bacillus cereus 03BB108]EDX60099.1 hypothetical protein BC03BB108_B0255 [Bacillus cereus 03BB108]EOQ19740.1 hypothetical protein IKC_04214 [Bacillus cereus VD184]